MGWLFGKRKIDLSFDEKALQFPTSFPPQKRIIEPEALKEAVGFNRSAFSEEHIEVKTPTPQMKMPAAVPQSEVPPEESMLYVKVDVYQRILGELDEIKANLTGLQHIQKRLETSEYNEETNFTRLRRAVKGLHDRLLQADKVLFKG